MAAGEHILAVGDIHGELRLLTQVLDELVPTLPRQTRLVFLGDYIDRGPDSRAVLERILALRAERPDTVFLMGNHERMLLDALEGRGVALWVLNGGEETLASYGLRVDQMNLIPPEHLAFMRSLELMHTSGRYVFVHAGVAPDRPLDRQVERDLLWIRDGFYGVRQKGYPEPEHTVVFGHTPFPRPYIRPGMIGIDTGAVYGGRLTCLKLPEEELFSFPAL